MRKMGKRCIRGLFTTGLLAAGIFLYREELLAAPAEEGKIIAYANVNSCLNIRTGKGTEYEVKAQLPKDGCCEILEDAGDWCRISSDGIEGYVFKAYLITGISEKEYLALTQRREPVYAYRISEEKTNKADKIQTASAGVQNASKGEELVQFALQFVGNPYVWGGTSLTEGADCSGFVQSVYQNFGISLPRVAADQANAGTRVALTELLPGDLIFYADGGEIYHVVLYMGDNQVVHASSKATGIKVSNVCWEHAVQAVRLL